MTPQWINPFIRSGPLWSDHFSKVLPLNAALENRSNSWAFGEHFISKSHWWLSWWILLAQFRAIFRTNSLFQPYSWLKAFTIFLQNHYNSCILCPLRRAWHTFCPSFQPLSSPCAVENSLVSRAGDLAGKQSKFPSCGIYPDGHSSSSPQHSAVLTLPASGISCPDLTTMG